VLTAAHCIQPKLAKIALLPRDVRVLLGVFDLSDPFEIGRISVAIEEIKMHPNWNPSTSRYDGDIAVLQMEDPVTFNKFIQPICLFSSDSNALSFGNGTIVGYGLSAKDSNSAEPIPKILNVPIVGNYDCFHNNPILASISSRNTFCAGYGNGSGVCFGDSGSGLYIKHNKTQYLKGIVSASLIDSDRECDVNDYAVFTEVSNYYDWITDRDDFILSQNRQRVLTKTDEVATLKTASG
jgi:secreted trypsin-like serine protease